MARNGLSLSVVLFGAVLLDGCGGSAATSLNPPSIPPTSPNPPAATYAYVPRASIDGATGGVDVVSLTASGTISPATVFTDADGGLSSLVMDSGNDFWAIEHKPVAGSLGTYAIVEFDARATGVATPLRRIKMNPSLTGLVYTITLDKAGGVYAGTEEGIEYFAPGANGNASPLRTIGGPATGLGTVAHLAVDGDGNVSEVNLDSVEYSVRTFVAGASGNVAPSRIVTTYPFNTLVEGLFADAVGNLYVTSTFITGAKSQFTSFTPTIQEFAANSTTLMRTITPSGDQVRVAGLNIDAVGNLWTYTENLDGQDGLQQFSATASGNVAPSSRLLLSSAGNNDGSLALR